MGTYRHISDGRANAGKYVEEGWCVALRAAAHSMTYLELAKLAHFGRTRVAEIMGGQRRPTIDELMTLSAALRLPQLRMLDIAGHVPGTSNLLAYVDQLEEQATRTELAAERVPSVTCRVPQ